MGQPLDENYWDDRYSNNSTGWDVGKISTPLKDYIDQLKDKNIAILIPGCGNAYEAEYLIEKGFTNITIVDISPVLINAITKKMQMHMGNQLHIICGDFFALNQQFDLIIEQTFFCALDPTLRTRYVNKMFEILSNDGKLVGVLFDRSFDGGPPFGGNKPEYESLFSAKFSILQIESCYNSIEPRNGSELFIILKKK